MISYYRGYTSLDDSETIILYIISNNQSRNMPDLNFNRIVHLMVRILRRLLSHFWFSLSQSNIYFLGQRTIFDDSPQWIFMSSLMGFVVS